MLIAIVSDLHLTSFDPWGRNAITDNIHGSIEQHKPDVLIDAGDAEEEWYRGKIPYIPVMGNHDFYHDDFYPGDGQQFFAVGGLTFACATLWTDLNKDDPLTGEIVRQGMNDFNYINGFTTEKWRESHAMDVEFLKRRPVDVIVSHHLPSFKSVHQKYRSETVHDLMNYGFASHLDELVEELTPKLWIHAHTHERCDYKIGKTRVVCHPCGYSHERLNRPYEPLYIRI